MLKSRPPAGELSCVSRRVVLVFLSSVLALGLFPLTAPRAANEPLPLRALAVPYPLDTFARNALSGGPRRDGIPSIDEPRFIDARAADRLLDPEDVVFGVTLNGETKAYPQRILVWHEIVNDRFGGENVSVTYCPLTGTAIGFRRGATTFGVSGQLVNSNLIMYERATGSLWPQILATAVKGDLKGRSLAEIPVVWTRWSRWKSLHPATRVLSTDTGFARNYRRDPYGSYTPLGGYYATTRPPLFPTLGADPRLAPKEVVIGARTAGGAVAFKKAALRQRKLVAGEIAGVPHLAVYDPRLDTAYVYRNPNGRPFTYDNGMVNDATGRWAPDQLPLERVNAFDAMWFAWYAFFPTTTVQE